MYSDDPPELKKIHDDRQARIFLLLYLSFVLVYYVLTQSVGRDLAEWLEIVAPLAGILAWLGIGKLAFGYY